MIKGKFIKIFALSICMSVLFTGLAYASSGEGSSPAYEGKTSVVDTNLLEMQREMDQYLFVDNVKEIDKLGFTVVYTGVADEYVEVGITPYTDENAGYIYKIFGKEQVKVVGTDEAVLYAPDALAPDVLGSDEIRPEDIPVDSDNEIVPIIDIGNDTPAYDLDTSVSDSNLMEEQELIGEREKRALEGDDNISNEDMDELMRQTAVVEDLPIADIDSVEDIKVESIEDDGYMTTQDDTVRIVSDNSENDTSSENDSKIKPIYIVIIAGGVIALGGVAFVSSRKKAVKK